MNDGPYFLPQLDCLDISLDQIFQPDAQSHIKAWLTHFSTMLHQKESFLQVLLDFDDRSGGFYQYRAFLLAADYLALCPDCRQGDAIVDQLLKVCYSYFRNEKADWCSYPDFLVQSAREQLTRTDLGRVVDRFETLIQQTESRSMMSHAARQLLKIQPENRCAIAAIVFNKLTPDPTSKKFTPQDPYIHLQETTALRDLVEKLIQSDEVAGAISQVLTCNGLERYFAVKILIHHDATHPLVFPYLWELTLEGKSRYVYFEDQHWEFPDLVDNLWRSLYSLDATCRTKLMEKIDRWDEDCREDTWLAIQILGKLGQGNQEISDLLIVFLEKLERSSFSEASYGDVIDTLGKIGISTPDLIDRLNRLFQEVEFPESKYKIAIALAQLDRQIDSINWIQEALSQVIDSEFTVFLGYPLYDRLACDLYRQALYCESTKDFAIEVLTQVLQANWNWSYYWRIRDLLSKIDTGKSIVINAILHKISSQSSTLRVEILDTLDIELVQEIKAKHPWVLQSIEKSLKSEMIPEYSYTIAQSVLRFDPGNLVAIEVLYGLAKTIQTSESSADLNIDIVDILCLLILNDSKKDQFLQQWLSQVHTPTIYEIEVITRTLCEFDSGDFQVFLWIVNHIELVIQQIDASTIYVSDQDIYDGNRLGKLIFLYLKVLSEDDLRLVIIAIRDRLNQQADRLYSTYQVIVWECTQRFPYKIFYQAFHS